MTLEHLGRCFSFSRAIGRLVAMVGVSATNPHYHDSGENVPRGFCMAVSHIVNCLGDKMDACMFHLKKLEAG